MSGLPALGARTFEDMKMTNEHGAEFWSARELQALLGYTEWRNFSVAIKRAQKSCEASGNLVENHFGDVNKMVELGSGGQRSVGDVHLSRFACYLIAQNGDPQKPEISLAQQYFAVQARRQELNDDLAADLERIELRKHAGEEFKALSGAAQAAGVGNRMFGVFHDAGYKGLYGGLGKERIKDMKGIPAKDNLMDRMNATELAANQFRMTQTRDALAREDIRGEQKAIDLHQSVGREVREAIRRIGGTLPENIPADEHIKQVQKRVKAATPKLSLDDRDAAGLLGRADDDDSVIE